MIGMQKVYFGIIQLAWMFGFALFFIIAVRRLPDSPQNRKLKQAVAAWGAVGVVILLAKELWRTL